MGKITVREATRNDLDTLLRFEQGIIKAERPFDGTLKEEHIHYYDIEGMLSDPKAHIAVAESDAEIIGSGFARIEISKPYLTHTRHAWLGFMYVNPSYRGKGVNKKIIDALKQWSQKQGITEFRLSVYPDNDAAIHAYEKAGFKEYLLEMRMNVNEK